MIDVMNQWVSADAAAATQTPLHHVNFAELGRHQTRRLTGDAAGLVLREMPLHGLLSLRANPQRVNLSAAVSSVLDLALPEPLRAVERDGRCLRWMAPDEWWLSCGIDAAFRIEQDLREALNGHHAIVNLSGGYTTLVLSGWAARSVLQKSTGYDVHPRAFAPGKVVRTLFGKTGVALRCIEPLRYEIIARRSFADYLWLWLQAASEEYGLRIET